MDGSCKLSFDSREAAATCAMLGRTHDGGHGWPHPSIICLPLPPSLQALNPEDPQSIERDDYALSIANMDE